MRCREEAKVSTSGSGTDALSISRFEGRQYVVAKPAQLHHDL
jgi:hypothetical protein